MKLILRSEFGVEFTLNKEGLHIYTGDGHDISLMHFDEVTEFGDWLVCEFNQVTADNDKDD